MSEKDRTKEQLEEEVKHLELKVRELNVTSRELTYAASTDCMKFERLLGEQELLRRAIEVSTNASAKIPDTFSTKWNVELLELMLEAAKKLRESIKNNL